ncbi:MAG: PEP-CTERM sorting domain-containing protein [Verrucomicrobiaceae bacterium]
MKTRLKITNALRGLLSGLFLLAAGTFCAQGAVVLYTDRATWEAAAGGGIGDILDDLNSGTTNRGSYVIGGTSLNAFPNSNVQTSIDGSGYARFLLSNTNNGSLTFNLPITALGYDLNPQGPNAPQAYGRTVLVTLDGSPISSYILPAFEGNGFVGFVSDTPFTSYVITTAETDAWHGVDNIEAFSSSVPEPSRILLLLGGLMGVMMRRRRW